MQFIRIGGKIISKRKIVRAIDIILDMRSSGAAQQKVADQLGIDRTFVSRLEALGEVRKGHRIAVIGFPIKNKDEIVNLLQREGIEFSFIMTETERWDFVRKNHGIDLLNKVTNLIIEAKSFDVVIVIGSNQRIKTIEAILDQEVIGLEIGQSPIEEDKYVVPEKVLDILQAVKKKAICS